jgi:hypothetical protein
VQLVANHEAQQPRHGLKEKKSGNSRASGSIGNFRIDKLRVLLANKKQQILRLSSSASEQRLRRTAVGTLRAQYSQENSDDDSHCNLRFVSDGSPFRGSGKRSTNDRAAVCDVN